MHLLQPELLGDAPQDDADGVAGRHRLTGAGEEQLTRPVAAEAVDVAVHRSRGALSEADPAIVLVLGLADQRASALPVHVV